MTLPSYTSNLHLAKPTRSEREWDIPLNSNVDILDALTAIGSLTVTPVELPSQSLQVRVSAGNYLRTDSTIALFGGANALAIPGNSHVLVWLTEDGLLSTGTVFPSAPHLRLASVTTNATTISSISDQRVYCVVAGQATEAALTTVDVAGGTFAITSPSTHQSFLTVNVNDETVGFFGATPSSQIPKITPLQASTASVPADLIQDVGSTFSTVTLNGNFVNITAKVNLLISALQRHGLMSI